MPPISRNWSLRGSLYVRKQLLSDGWRDRDALFVHTLTVGLLANKVYAEVPTVISIDATPLNLDSLAKSYDHKVHSGFLEKAKLSVAKRAVAHARAFVAWSNWAKDSLVADYGADPNLVRVIAPGTNLDLFQRPAGAREPGPVRILFVGGDFIRKGGDLLLEVFRRHLAGSTELHLVTGYDLPPEPGVFIHKNLGANSEPLLDLYRRADIFAQPTRADCLAVVLGEAMAASLPVVTTNVGGHGEIVEHGSSGYVLKPDDVDGLRDALESLVADPALRQSMGARGREIAEASLDANRNAEAIIELMEAIA